jgi:uracil DNA glycosylase
MNSAAPPVSEFFAAVAIFGPWLTVIIITVTCVVLSHVRRSRERELGAEMIRDMLGKKMTANEIEQVLIAWGGRSRQVKKLLQEQVRAAAVNPPAGKPVHAMV